MFAPDFTLSHLFLYIQGYEDARSDAGQPSQYEHFQEWLYLRHPEWRGSPMWWGRHLLEAQAGNLERTLAEIVTLLDQFLAAEGAEFIRFADRTKQEE
jgi:hypothetical protein